MRSYAQITTDLRQNYATTRSDGNGFDPRMQCYASTAESSETFSFAETPFLGGAPLHAFVGKLISVALLYPPSLYAHCLNEPCVPPCQGVMNDCPEVFPCVLTRSYR